MNFLRSVRLLLTALAFTLAAGAATPPASQPVTDSPSTTSFKGIDVDFPGGSLSALVTLVRKAGGSLNVVGEKDDLAVELPALSLRDTDATALGAAIAELLRHSGYSLNPVQGSHRSAPVPVFVLRKYKRHEDDQRTVPQFATFQLGPYLGQQNVDDIVGAIHTAWELDPANDPKGLRIKFHPPTGILLVSAPPHGLGTVSSVLGQLKRTPEQNSKSAQKASPAPSPDEPTR